MDFTFVINLILIVVVVALVAFILFNIAKNKKSTDVVNEVERERQKYSVSGMIDYIKNEFDEITRMNLCDLALSEEEFERRKNTKYELKKALKGAGYAATNDKKYVKTLMFDLLRNQYKVTERNINYAIPFDNAERLTEQDKFDILLHIYKQTYKRNALTEIITKYALDNPEFDSEGVPSYRITREQINEIFEK